MRKPNSSKKSFLSLIIPAYKQQKTIQQDIFKISHITETLKYKYEIIVVVDGFMDKTFEKAKKISSQKIKVIGYPTNHGKGYAVRFGMAQAKGDIIAFLDAGMDIDPRSMMTMLETFISKKADIVIGSKLHPLSHVNYPWQRKILSVGYRMTVKSFFGLSASDTQVGLKMFRRKVLEDVLPRLLVKNFAFDIEILAVAYRLGYKKIIESPVNLHATKWSSITTGNFWKIIYLMLLDTAAVFYRLRILKYYDNKSRRKWRYDPELNFRVNTG